MDAAKARAGAATRLAALEVDDLEGASKQLRRDLDDAQLEFEDEVRRGRAELERQRDELKEQRHAMQRRAQDVETRLALRTQAMDKERSQIEAARAKNVSKAAELEHHTQRVKALEAQLEHQTQELQSKRSLVEDLQRDLDTQRETREAALASGNAALARERDALLQERDDLQQQWSELQDRQKQLEVQESRMARRLADAQDQDARNAAARDVYIAKLASVHELEEALDRQRELVAAAEAAASEAQAAADAALAEATDRREEHEAVMAREEAEARRIRQELEQEQRQVAADRADMRHAHKRTLADMQAAKLQFEQHEAPLLAREEAVAEQLQHVAEREAKVTQQQRHVQQQLQELGQQRQLLQQLNDNMETRQVRSWQCCEGWSRALLRAPLWLCPYAEI